MQVRGQEDAIGMSDLPLCVQQWHFLDFLEEQRNHSLKQEAFFKILQKIALLSGVFETCLNQHFQRESICIQTHFDEKLEQLL